MRNKLFLTLAVTLFLTLNSGKAQITTGSNDKSWLLETENMTYVIKVINDQVQAGYYGPRLKQTEITSIPFSGNPEIPVRGGFANKSPILELIFSDGTRDLDLKYESYTLSKKDGYPLLKIDQKDTFYPVRVSAFYRVIPEYDIIEKWIEITNTGNKETIKIENALSGSLGLPQGAYEMTHFSGMAGQEFQPETSLLTQGIKTIQSRDFKTYGSSYFAVRRQGECDDNNGETWYGQLHYSGNWKADFESMYTDRIQIVSGINFWDTEWNLRPSETFTTPVLSFGYTQKGTNAAAQNYTGYIRSLILPQKRSRVTRPVIYNSWYATGFDINEKQQAALAKGAKELGVEMFVIDDGWFKNRLNSKSGLGDWSIDKNKFPNGLTPLIGQVNEMGMDFGIWIEPEMVNPNSDLYRAHPDWVLHFNNRPRTLGRNQLMLNLARQDVFDYLYNSFFELLKNHNIKYIKWDMNKTITEPGWPAADSEMQREVRIRYINNLYKLVDKLTAAFPDVWFETCASGGGRIDLGIFKRTDFAWVSDNIDPLDRIFIQYGYLNVFPANTMISWTGTHDKHGIKPSLDFRFDVAMSGVLGMSNDITKWTQEEMQTAKRKVAEYKRIRETVHNGKLYKLASPFIGNRAVLQYNNEDQTESVIFCYQLDQQLKGSTKYPHSHPFIKLQGLKGDRYYQIEGQEKKYSGQDLMNTGIPYPLSKAYTSKIIILKNL